MKNSASQPIRSRTGATICHVNPKPDARYPSPERNLNTESRSRGLAREFTHAFSARRRTHFGFRNSSFFRISPLWISGFRLGARRLCASVILPFAVGLLPWLAQAFPPAPDGVIYGLVKDQYGTPLMNTADMVVLQTPAGVQVMASIQPGLAIGVNYAIHVPMDAGIIPGPYVSKALTAATPYTLYVSVGGTTNLPIEMMGATPVLGQPAQLTLQNLTLGVDANGDGIPDAWETVFLQETGATNALAFLTANTVIGGRTVLQQYLLGNYPTDPTNVFNVQLVSQNAGSAVLAFTAITGRSYTVLGSPDLKNWTTLSFTMPASGPNVMSSYYASIIQPLQIQTVQPASVPPMQFFRLQLQ